VLSFYFSMLIGIKPSLKLSLSGKIKSPMMLRYRADRQVCVLVVVEGVEWVTVVVAVSQVPSVY